MCIGYKVNVVVTGSPFEAGRSEVDVSEVCWWTEHTLSWIILIENSSQY